MHVIETLHYVTKTHIPMYWIQMHLFVSNVKDGRSMTTFYFYSVNHQSGLQRNTFSKLSYIFLIHQNVPQIMSFRLSYMMVS